jgi:hypothetical protein
MRKGALELKDLDVDRVDGVDKPATGKNFLLFKGADGDLIMKSYGALATVANEVLSKARTDKNMTVSRKSAIALNGLAQVLGQDPVFVGKSVPTQPYEFVEPDADKRGPADEKVGENFTPRSMPGSMVGSVAFRLKDEEDEEDEGKGKAKVAAKGKNPFAAEGDEDEEDGKGKGKGKTKVKDADGDEADMDATERTNRGVARSVEGLATAVKGLVEASAAQTAAINKMLGIAKVAKAAAGEGEEDEPERVAKARPRSRQVEDEDAPVRVRKQAGGYEPRFGVSFSDVAFGKQ